MSKSAASILMGTLGAFCLLSGAAAPILAAESECDAIKVKAAAKKLTAKAKCHAKALKKDIPVDLECLTKAEEKFEAAFQKADEKDKNCTNLGDSAVVEGMVDAFLTNLVSQVTVPAAVCAPGETSCLGLCVDLETDEANCGACGISCDVGEVCTNAECVAAP